MKTKYIFYTVKPRLDIYKSNSLKAMFNYVLEYLDAVSQVLPIEEDLDTSNFFIEINNKKETLYMNAEKFLIKYYKKYYKKIIEQNLKEVKL